MADEVIKLGDLITLVMQLNIVSNLIGNLLDKLQEVVFDSLEGALSHEAELNLLREVDVPDEEFYVYAGVLGMAYWVSEEVLGVEIDALGDFSLFLEDVEGFVEE